MVKNREAGRINIAGAMGHVFTKAIFFIEMTDTMIRQPLGTHFLVPQVNVLAANMAGQRY